MSKKEVVGFLKRRKSIGVVSDTAELTDKQQTDGDN